MHSVTEGALSTWLAGVQFKPRPPGLLCFSHAQFGPAFLECSFSTFTGPAHSRDSGNGSYSEHLFGRSLRNRISIQKEYQEGGRVWDQAVQMQIPHPLVTDQPCDLGRGHLTAECQFTLV